MSFDRTCRQCGKPHGKPAVRGGDLEFSVAHSGDLVAVAVATAPVGVDVEQLEERPRELGGGDPDTLARLVLADEERAALASVHPSGRAHAFLVAWTRKEAVTKAKGDGLRVPFTEVVVATHAGQCPAGGVALPAGPAERLAARPRHRARVRGGAGGPRPL